MYYSIPDDLFVYAKIFMNDEVAKIFYLPPGYLRMMVFDGIGELSYRLTDYYKLTQCRGIGFTLSDKIFKGQVFGVALYSLNCIENVFQIKFYIPLRHSERLS